LSGEKNKLTQRREGAKKRKGNAGARRGFKTGDPTAARNLMMVKVLAAT
jgi:hypothetical protein